MFRFSSQVLQPTTSLYKPNPFSHKQVILNQRQGVSNDPYEGSAPEAGTFLGPSRVNEFHWNPASKAFLEGVIDPFKKTVEWVGNKVGGVTQSVNGLGLAALATFGLAVAYRAFEKERALTSVLGLAGLGLALTSSVKALQKGTDKNNTVQQDGDWFKPAGTATVAAALGNWGLNYSSRPKDLGQFVEHTFMPWKRPDNVFSRVGNAFGNIMHGVARFPREALDIVGDIGEGFSRIFKRG